MYKTYLFQKRSVNTTVDILYHISIVALEIVFQCDGLSLFTNV
jgi:hypothetical protein